MAPDDRWLSVLVVGELRRGVDRLRGRDPDQAAALDAWVATLLAEYATRILPVDLRVAQRWGAVTVGDPLPTVDALLGATALEHDLTVATRNTRDVGRTGARTLDPWL